MENLRGRVITTETQRHREEEEERISGRVLG
jgi:hypothetical protein